MDFDSLLLNFLFILLPIFFYHLFVTLQIVREKEKRYESFLLVFFCTFSALACMYYRIELTEGFYYDLRFIPVLISILYGGYRAGIGVIAVTLFFRFLIGGDGFIVTVVVLLTILAAISPFTKAFLQTSMQNRLLIPAAISIFIQVGLFLNYFYHVGEYYPITFREWLVLIFINMAGTLLIFYVIELLRKIRGIQEELIKTEKLKAISQLGASISHEIRNPLTISKGFIQVLQTTELPPAKQKEYLALAVQEIDRANRIISEYLTFSKPANEEETALSVEAEVKKVTELVTPMANLKGVRLQTNIDSSCSIMGNKEKFQQCLVNIIKNGIEASSPGSVVEINSHCLENRCSIVIKDQGEGMTEKEINQLGTPYFSKKESGTGLGMLVVFHIVKKMNGKVSVKSEKNKGTTFTLTFPIEENLT